MIICVLLPFFAATVEQQNAPRLCDELLVLSDPARAVRRIAAVSKWATEADIQQGMVLRHAQTIAPEISVLPLNPPRYRVRLEELLDTLQTFSDQIEIAYKGWGAGDEKIAQSVQSAACALNPAVAFLDIGTANPNVLYQLGQQLQTALELHRFSPLIGIASNRFTAWVAAQAAQEGRVGFVPQGEEAWMLECHPVSFLPLNVKTLERLSWLGIRTLGDFARLPRAAMLPQFGKQGLRAFQLAHGIDLTPVPRFTRKRELSRAVAFEEGISDQQVLSAVLKELTVKLIAALHASGETARNVRLTLTLDRSGACEFETKLRRRTNTPAQLHSAVGKLIDTASIASAVSEITLTLGDIVPVAARQLELFPAMRVLESRQAVLDDLTARYGERFFVASIDDPESLLPQFQVSFKPAEEIA